MVWMFISFIFTSPCFPIPWVYLQIHRAISYQFYFFNPWWRRRSKITYSCENSFMIFFVSIYRDNFLSCIIEHRTTLPCYCPILFNFYLSHSETESSLLLVLKGCPLWLIFLFINTSFQIHSPLFISWKHNIIIIQPTCCRFSADLFGMDIFKEYKLGGWQWRKLFFVVTGWYMTYFHLFPFIFSEQYVEGEISQVVIFVSV